VEKEIFDLHKYQKLRFQSWKSKMNFSVEFNYDLLDDEAKQSIKRFKAI